MRKYKIELSLSRCWLSARPGRLLAVFYNDPDPVNYITAVGECVVQWRHHDDPPLDEILNGLFPDSEAEVAGAVERLCLKRLEG